MNAFVSIAMGRSSLLIVAVACLVAGLGAAPVRASSPAAPDALIVDGTGAVVAQAETRDEIPEAFEEAFASDHVGRLRVEYLYRGHGTVTTPPDDPLYFQQWNLNAVGLPGAWPATDGAGVLVAVLDSGIGFGGNDGICADVVFPYDALTLAATAAPPDTEAEFGHGTHIAGTLAQCTSNGVGVAGVAPGVGLLPVRVLDDENVGTSSQLATGIDWAVAHGADVVNMSLGSECFDVWPFCGDAIVDAAIARASASGVLLVASSGNSAAAHVAYPANHPDVLAVGAVGFGDLWWNPSDGVGSNRGVALDLVAPGVDILQETTSFGAYDFLYGSGTSMAVPHVTGAAAMVLSVSPQLSATEVADILIDTAVDVGAPGFDLATGWGRLDIDAALAAAVDLAQSPCLGTPCDSVVSVSSGGLWTLRDELMTAATESSFYFGVPGDVPFMGDWDGDGVATPGLYRQSDGYVYIRHTNTQGNADLEFFFGNPGDLPLVGDFDGDGRDSVSIWRASEARAYIVNDLGADGAGLGAADFFFEFGNIGDAPFVGDFDGDGIDTIGLHRESTGFVYFRDSLTTGTADHSFVYGDPGDRILVGDWDGDGDDTVAVYRPSTGRIYINLDNAPGAAYWDGFVGKTSWLVTAARS